MSDSEQTQERKSNEGMDSEQFNKANVLKRRIEDLKNTFVRGKDHFLKEDLKARGLK